MKHFYTTLIVLLFSINAFAQFPPPSNLTYSLQYNNDMWGVVCDGVNLPEYGYCSTFSWEAADTAYSDSDFLHYSLLMVDLNNVNDTVLLSTTEETLIEMPFGLYGYVCVKAVYSNPEGISEPSNWVYNGDLPIFIKEENAVEDPHLFFNPNMGTLNLDHGEEVKEICVFDINGKQLLKLDHFSGSKKINLTSGLYIVELQCVNGRVIKQKIMF